MRFPMMAKIDVNGPDAHPLYKWMTEAMPPDMISWNFGKFLINKDGIVVGRYEPKEEPLSIVPDIEKLL